MGENEAGALTPPAMGRTSTLTVLVTPPLTTVHLPPERAVLTTPGMLGLMERCIEQAESEAGGGRWQSLSADVRHRAGLRTGETLEVAAVLDEGVSDRRRWSARAASADGRLIGEGTIVRIRLD